MQFIKDPAAVLDYRLDWSPWLAEGETITASTMTAATGISMDSQTHDATTATVWLSGGTLGQQYAVTNHITTSAGRQDERTFTVTLRDR